MKYLRTYEGPKPPFNQEQRKKFIDSKNEPYTTINLTELRYDCYTNNIDFLELLKEILIDKKISFQCTWCFDDNIEDNMINLYDSHSIVGKCIDIIYEDEGHFDSDVLVKVDGYDGWHTLSISYTRNSTKQKKVRIYNYSGGELINKLNIIKDIGKYNL